MRIAITPGSMGAAALAIKIFGLNRVDAGSWTSPVWIFNLTQDEVDFAIELFGEYGLNVTMVEL